MSLPPYSPPKPYRASLMFLSGLVLAAGVAVGFDETGRVLWRASAPVAVTEAPDLLALPPRALDASDLAAGRAAWAYFAANTQRESGLVDSVAGYPSATLWDLGSYLLALVSARRLDIVSLAEFESRASQVLITLGKLQLVEGRLPNKAYDTRSLAMVDYANQPVDGGIGWSALDIARLLVALRAIEETAPQLRPSLGKAIERWDINSLAAGGEIIGADRENGDLRAHQEGRIGYEQYGARALLQWGIEATTAVSAARILDWEEIGGIEVPADLRNMRAFGAIDAVLSEPYMLHGLEFGLKGETAVLAARVYRAQESRFEKTGVPTMVSEDHIDQAPRFLYASVYGNGAAWAVLDENGSGSADCQHEGSFRLGCALWHALHGQTATADGRAAWRSGTRLGCRII
jgi:hypothetical protein